jgi:antitoxin (DNA-binding transcriptional repressor) of toxin-antitoxin stability system
MADDALTQRESLEQPVKETPTGNWICGRCPMHSPYDPDRRIVRDIAREDVERWLSINGAPFAARTRGRWTLAVPAALFRANMARILYFVEQGQMRLVLCQKNLAVAAIVPLPDLWFLLDIEQELHRLGWTNRRPPRPEAVAQAIIDAWEATVLPTCRQASSPTRPRSSRKSSFAPRDVMPQSHVEMQQGWLTMDDVTMPPPRKQRRSSASRPPSTCSSSEDQSR